MSNLTRTIKVSADELQVFGADAQEARADLAALIDRTNRDQPKTKDIKMLNKVMDAIPKINDSLAMCASSILKSK